MRGIGSKVCNESGASFQEPTEIALKEKCCTAISTAQIAAVLDSGGWGS
jgi:hypothetical protein